MRTWLASRSGIIIVTAVIVIGAILALLSAIVGQGLSVRTVGASLLASSFFVFLPAGILYSGRAFMNWQIEATSHLRWERGFVIAAIMATALGLGLLADMLRTAGEPVFSQIGMTAYLLGAAVILVAETAYLSHQEWHYPQVVTYIMLAFLAQAAFGIGLLQTNLVAAWVGWAAILWNLGFMLIMLIVRPRDIYYPVLHHVAPLIIGIALLVQG